MRDFFVPSSGAFIGRVLLPSPFVGREHTLRKYRFATSVTRTSITQINCERIQSNSKSKSSSRKSTTTRTSKRRKRLVESDPVSPWSAVKWVVALPLVCATFLAGHSIAKLFPGRHPTLPDVSEVPSSTDADIDSGHTAGSMTAFGTSTGAVGLATSSSSTRILPSGWENGFVKKGKHHAVLSRESGLAREELPLNSKALVLMDAKTGRLLVKVNPHVRLEPASITKIMTSYVISKQLALGKLKLSDMVDISYRACSMGGSTMFLNPGTSASVSEMMGGIMGVSANDACVAMAEHIAGSEEAFVEMMNNEATALGMRHTHFMNASGLPHPDHYSTPRDLAVLARAFIHKYPNTYKLCSRKTFTYNNITQANRNPLLHYPATYQADGIKTGYTNNAGYCLSGSATGPGGRVISVTLGAPTPLGRRLDNERLIAFGLRFLESKL